MGFAGYIDENGIAHKTVMTKTPVEIIEEYKSDKTYIAKDIFIHGGKVYKVKDNVTSISGVQPPNETYYVETNLGAEVSELNSNLNECKLLASGTSWQTGNVEFSLNESFRNFRYLVVKIKNQESPQRTYVLQFNTNLLNTSEYYVVQSNYNTNVAMGIMFSIKSDTQFAQSGFTYTGWNVNKWEIYGVERINN